MPYTPTISSPIISSADEYSMGHVVPDPDDGIEHSPTPDYYFEEPLAGPRPQHLYLGRSPASSLHSIPRTDSATFNGYEKYESSRYLGEDSDGQLNRRTGYQAPPSPDPNADSSKFNFEIGEPTITTRTGQGVHAIPSMSYSNLNTGTEWNPRSNRFPIGIDEQSGSVTKKKKKWVWIGIGISILVVLAVVIPVVYVVIHNQQKRTGSSSSPSSSTPSSKSPTSKPSVNGTQSITTFNPLDPLTGPDPSNLAPQSGTSGSTITTYVNGTKTSFTYINNFGGSWAIDPVNPWNVSGQAQSWVPKITEEWVWGKDTIRGVNLGGWLVLEPFICPAMFETYGGSIPGDPDGKGQTVGAIDEWTLSTMMRTNLGDAGFEAAMREHYETFITEQDFAEMAGAGLNYIRIPLGFWAISTVDSAGEPYLAGVSWEYFVRAVGWARKYGLRILLDMHALPGSQNGWNHSGKSGVVNWMYGVMGLVNGVRTLEYVRSLTEFVSQDQYKDVVTMLSLVNEVQASVVGFNAIASFYYQAYDLIRSITGYGAGKGPIIVLHDNFQGIAKFVGFLSGSDRVAVDQHPYLAFPTTPNTNPWSTQWASVCSWAGGTNDSQTNFGLTIGGEWSMAINDCGLWLVGVGGTPTYSAVGSCAQWDDWRLWTDQTKADVQTMAKANMDSLQNWFHWTWKIGNSTHLGYDSSPFWHYKRGLEQGWVPSDPRSAAGTCASLGIGGGVFKGVFPASATGGGPNTIAADQVSSYGSFPPASMGPSPSFTAQQIAVFPTFTPTGSPVTLRQAAMATGVVVGNGWHDPQDTAGAYTTVSGCSYPDYYNATAASLVPTAACAGR